jgi:hypothetical protein
MSDDGSKRPAPGGFNSWPDYWTAQGMPWRTEPEISEERQRYLEERRAIKPDMKRGIYPFRSEDGGIKLTRAEVAWLLATHTYGGTVGPVRWEDEVDNQPEKRRWGVDLRGADLRSIDLSGLPLARVQGGLTWQLWSDANLQQLDAAAIQLQDADLRKAHLEYAELRGAHLERLYAREVCLQGADMFGSHLEGASLYRAQFAGAGVPTEQQGPAHGQQREIGLPPADIRRSFLDGATNLHSVWLGHRKYGSVRLGDVQWSDANLARVQWTEVGMLGDEQKARRQRGSDSKPKPHKRRLEEYEDAVRANRQLALVLRSQGVNEQADRFAYRAQVLLELTR